MVWISAVIVLATAALSLAAPIPADRQRIDDTVVLKTFSALTKMQASLYEQMVAKFTDDDYDDAGFDVPEVPKQLLNELLTDEKIHTTFFDAGLAGNPLNGCQFNFTQALTNVKSALATARWLEEVSVATFQGASQLLADKNILSAALAIMPNEAQHQFVMNFMNGQSGSPHSFGMALRPEQALSIISPFITGCDVGILGNRPLGLTSTTLAPGQRVEFNTTGLDTRIPLFCQMMVEGRPTALSQPLEQCLLPNDIIEGPVYMYITNKVEPLPANVQTQDTSSIEAGPVIAFINGTSTPFNQVLMPGLDVGGTGGTNGRTFTFRGGASDVRVVGVHTLSTKPAIRVVGVSTIINTGPAAAVKIIGVHNISATAPTGTSATPPVPTAPTAVPRRKETDDDDDDI